MVSCRARRANPVGQSSRSWTKRQDVYLIFTFEGQFVRHVITHLTFQSFDQLRLGSPGTCRQPNSGIIAGNTAVAILILADAAHHAWWWRPDGWQPTIPLAPAGVA